MSDSHQKAHADEDVHDAVHEGPVRTVNQLIWTVLASFVLPVVIIIMLVNYVDFDNKPSAGSEGLMDQAVALRLQRVGQVDYRDTSNPAAQRNGDIVYQGQCAACHAAGAANAPKLGDVAAWGPRLKQGFDTLLNSALKGKGAMGPQAGGDFTDFEVARAVAYMANQGGGRFDEPKMPATVTAAAAASAPK